MLVISIGLLVILTLAGLVTLYVAYPHRGEDIPHAEWLSDAMSRSNQKVTAQLSQWDDNLAARVHDRRRD